MEKEGSITAALLTVAWATAKVASSEKRYVSQKEIFSVYKNYKEEVEELEWEK